MKAAFAKLVARIRKHFGSFEYALVWELTKKGTPHCHILIRSGYIPQKWISRQWDHLGIGPIVYIKSVKGNKLHAAHACKYLAKSNGQTARSLAPLRLIQLSAGFDLPGKEKSVPQKYPDHVWTWDKRPAWEIAEIFAEHTATINVVKNKDGTYEIEMHAHPVTPDMIEVPDQWASWPGLAPVKDFYDST